MEEPAAIMAGLHGALAEGDEDGVRLILEECKKRGVKVDEMIAAEKSHLDALFGSTKQRISGKKIRIPFQLANGR